MTLRPLKYLAVLSLISAPVFLPAQTSSSEEVRLEKLMADSAQWYVPRTTVSIGFRVLQSGGKVNFGSLGNVPFELKVEPASAGEVDRVYDNGSVRKDLARFNEKDADGNVITVPGTRYVTTGTVTGNVVDSNGNNVLDADGNPVTQNIVIQTGDYLAYTPGLSRVWAYGAASQVTPDGTHIAMSTYSATSEGGAFEKETGASAGVEFQYVHTFSKPAARLQWGMLSGITLNGINSKTAGSVSATLHTRTDYYSLGGAAAPTAPYLSTAAFEDFTAATGDVFADGLETTIPIASLPDSHKETDTVGGTTVDGNWQVRGAYFMVRVGPTIRTQLTTRLGVNASLGLAGAYAGTTYSVAERFQVPDLADVYVGNSSGTEQSSKTKFLSGYYADLNLEWTATDRTGIFGGFTAQKLDGYDQEVGGRTARVDLGSSVGLRGGVSIKF